MSIYICTRSLHVYVCVYMYARWVFVCVCVYVYMFVHGVYMCVCLPQNPRRPLSSGEGEENRSCLHRMVTESWLGLFNGLAWQHYAMWGGHVRWPGCGWKFYMWARWFTHTRTEFACVCAYVYIYGQGFAMCVSVCSRVCTQRIHVCVQVYVYAHRECTCVYACLHILHVCVYIFMYSHRVFMCDFQHVYTRLSSPRRGVIVSKCHKWPCHERVCVTNICRSRNSTDGRNS